MSNTSQNLFERLSTRQCWNKTKISENEIIDWIKTLTPIELTKQIESSKAGNNNILIAIETLSFDVANYIYDFDKSYATPNIFWHVMIYLYNQQIEEKNPELFIKACDFFCKILDDFILNHVYCLEQDFYYYNLNSQMKKKWYYSKIITYKIYLELNMSFEEIRELGLKCKIRKRGGWHLSYFGDKYFIINKMHEFSHQEYNNSNYVSLDIIDSRIIYQTSLYETNKEESSEIIKLAIKDNEYLPPLYKEYLSKYIMY
jgi:hypothetical protein